VLYRLNATTFALLILTVALPSLAAVSGEAVYQKRCASCHDSASDSIPPRDTLKQLSAARILRTLDFGVMINISYLLNREEREAVANYLGVQKPDAPLPEQAYCAERSVKIGAAPNPAWSGWGPTLSNTRYNPSSGITLNQVSKLKLKWAYAFEGDVSAFGAPTVLGGTLFVGSAGGAVQALSSDSGCVRWMYQADGPVRSAMVAVPNGKTHVLVFTDLNGWAYGLEAETGVLLWKKRPEAHESTRLTGSAAVNHGVVFIPAASSEEPRANNPEYPCCTFRGSVTALRAKDGTQVWKTYTIPEKAKEIEKAPGTVGSWGPSGAGVWGSPTVDARRGLLYVATGDNFSSPATDLSDSVLALELKTGRIAWSRQMTPGDVFSGACTAVKCPGPDHDFGSSVIMEKLPDGRDVLLAGQKSGVVYALDPDRTGAILWQTRVGKGGTNGGVQWGMASDGQYVYAAVSDLVRKTRPGVIQIGATPDPTQGGGLTALRISDGEKVWYAAPPPCSRPKCSPAQPAAVTAIPGAVFSGSDDGHLRAFATEDGRVLWDFDTVREYKAVNGAPGKGGSLDGAGPVLTGGMLFVNSGYARNGGMAGNVLLAFAPAE
jgi:polyvinyl alcohol dehydrogenase (cytochrome)